jgi:hypothetical protein
VTQLQVAGLTNPDNRCHTNAVLQALAHTPGFLDAAMDPAHGQLEPAWKKAIDFLIVLVGSRGKVFAADYLVGLVLRLRCVPTGFLFVAVACNPHSGLDQSLSLLQKLCEFPCIGTGGREIETSR